MSDTGEEHFIQRVVKAQALEAQGRLTFQAREALLAEREERARRRMAEEKTGEETK